ncbi:hypothetical protein QUA79_15110 [Microcoleus sp. F8-D1]
MPKPWRCWRYLQSDLPVRSLRFARSPHSDSSIYTARQDLRIVT